MKLSRANDHLQVILRTVSDMAHTRCQMIPEECPDMRGFGVLRIRLTPPPPMDLSLTIGDFLFNARSALDYLVWQLVLANNNEPGRSNMFPLAATPKAFKEEVKRGRLQGVAPEAQKLIEAMQPYNDGNESLLTLGELHNTDKHRELNLTTAVARDTSVQWSDAAGPVVGMTIGNEELRDGAIFGGLAMPLTEPSMRERFFQIKVEGHATTFIAFDDPTADELEPLRVDTVLPKILHLVRNIVVPAFRPFFL